MKLYHGSNEKTLLRALEGGLVPRSISGNNNWGHTIGSNPHCVYLTEIYSGYFAANASQEGEKWGILEIETEALDSKLFRPDEDFLEQCSRRGVAQSRLDPKDRPASLLEKAAGKQGMLDRTRFFRKNLDEFSFLWRKSVEVLGNCAYKGKIPKDAITKAVTFDPSTNSFMAHAWMDPTITPMNHLICQGKYRALTRWLVESNPSSLELVTDFLGLLAGFQKKEDYLPMFENRAGILVHK